MKRICILFVLCFIYSVANAEEVEIEGINYQLFDGNNAEVISKSGGYIGDIVIPSVITVESTNYNVIQIRQEAFGYNRELTSISIPNSITFIGANAFRDCSKLSAVYINDLAAWCNIKFEGSVYGWTNPLCFAHHLFLNGEEIKNLVIPEGIQTINPWAFVGCSEFISITIPASVNDIWDLSFYKCDKINRINIKDLSAWCKIKFHRENVFGINSNPIGIAGHLYLNDEELTDLVLPDDIDEIKNFVFYGCQSLKSVKIHSGIANIGYQSFASCRNLETIELPSDLLKIGGGAFSYCKSIKSITIPNGVTSIDESAFSGCGSLTSLIIPNSVTTIGEGAFENCDGLKEVKISENLSSISSKMFSGCYNLKSIEFPDCVKSIGEYAFYECSGLTNFKIPQNVNYIRESAFYECSNLESIDMSAAESIEKIGNHAFYNCNKLSSLSFPNSLHYIGNYSFSNCSSLTSLELPSDLKGIGECAFNGCNGIKTIDIPNGVTGIGESAFSYCGSLTKISIPSSLQTISRFFLSHCGSIEDVYCYNENVPSTDQKAFISSNIGNATLHVPEGSIEDYKSREPWSSFKQIVSLDASSIISVINGNKKNNTWYDLNGNKLDGEPNSKGIFINNGKKVLK